MNIPAALRLVIRLARACLLAGLLPLCAHAATAGIDVVVVVDSSGSMKKSDPQTLRVPAAKLFFSLLGAPDSAALISFSEDGVTLRDLTPLTSNTERNALLRAADKITSDGKFTNLHAALERARALLSRHPSKDAPRYIVLMSDGKMDTGDAQRDGELIRSIHDELTPALVKERIKVHTIAFTDSSDITLLHDIAAGTDGLAKIAHTDKELHTVFSDMFERTKKPDMLPIENAEFLVDTAIEEVTIVASKDDAKVIIELQAPYGTRLSNARKTADVRWYATPQFDMITVPHPKTGKWKILFSRGTNKAYIVTNLKLAHDIDHHDKPINQKIVAHAWLTQGADKIVERAILDQTQIRGELELLDGTVTPLAFRDDGRAGDTTIRDGTFTSEFTLTQPGAHELRILADGATFGRKSAVVFQAVTPATEDKHDKPQPIAPIAISSPSAPKAETKSNPPSAPPDDSIGVWPIVGVFVLFNLFVATVVALVVLVKKQLRAKKTSEQPAE